jgi:hypothetical protein
MPQKPVKLMHIDIDTHKELVEMAEYGDSLSCSAEIDRFL